jgi:hypothetical protein
MVLVVLVLASAGGGGRCCGTAGEEEEQEKRGRSVGRSKALGQPKMTMGSDPTLIVFV